MNMLQTLKCFRLSERPYLIAATLSIVLVLWMLSGIFNEIKPDEKQTKKVLITQVRIDTLVAQNVHDEIELYGRTEPDRVTRLQAEIDGRVSKILVEKGAQVTKGQIIVRLSENDLYAQLRKNQSLLKQRKIEYEGALKLNADGYQGKVYLSKSLADLESVKAEIQRIEIEISKTFIRAPYDGVLSERTVEEGDFVKVGGNIAVITDLDPLVVRAHVTENQISEVHLGQLANVRLLNHMTKQGKIRYISSVANDMTNTFKIEIEIPNPNNQLFAGISGEIHIQLPEVSAIQVSPALLSLDEKGNIGIKTVENNQVHFIPAHVVKSNNEGVWLKGLGDKADVIILGQGFVRARDQVEAVFVENKVP